MITSMLRYTMLLCLIACAGCDQSSTPSSDGAPPTGGVDAGLLLDNGEACVREGGVPAPLLRAAHDRGHLR